jgi:hypothetical protein
MPFTVDAFTPNLIDYDAVFDISNINSIRFKDDETWSSSTLKTPYNTLSFEENVRIPNTSFLQLWTNDDIIRTQVNSNYETITAKLIDSNEAETSLIVSKMTANMNLTDVRDGTIVSATYNENNYTAVKYGSGNTYDPITLLDNGDYNLGTSAPTWMNKGDYVNIQGSGWHKVLDKINSNGYEVLILNLLYTEFTLTPGTFKITSVYNAINTEDYEFSCDFTLLSGYYKIEVTATDANFGTKTKLSEWQYIKSEHPRTYLIEYYNSENNEINYNTGITHKLRIPYVQNLEWNPNSELEIYVTDTNTVNLESKYRGFWSFTPNLLPTVMAEKLTLAFLQDRLFIETVNFLSEGEPESKKVGSQYQIIPNLVKSNYVYDSNSGLGSGTIVLPTGSPLSIDSDASGLLFVE